MRLKVLDKYRIRYCYHLAQIAFLWAVAAIVLCLMLCGIVWLDDQLNIAYLSRFELMRFV